MFAIRNFQDTKIQVHFAIRNFETQGNELEFFIGVIRELSLLGRGFSQSKPIDGARTFSRVAKVDP